MQKSKSRLAVLSVTGLLACVLVAGGAFAYLSDKDESINVFTVGDVHIQAWEPGFPTVDEDENGVPDECELLIPYEEIVKDPRIKNTGSNDCIVFFKVTAPVEVIQLIENKKKYDEQPMDLFWFKQADDSVNKHENNFNPNWIELKTLDNQFVECKECNDEGQGYTYIFGYHVKLAPGDITDTLFDKVQRKMFGSKVIKPDEIEQIRIESYAIQADNVRQDGVAIETEGELSEGVLTYIYETYVNQNQEKLQAGGGN